MSDLLNVMSLLTSVLSIPVYRGQIPESDDSSVAVAVTNVAYPFQGRTLSGRKYGKSSTWRITIVGDSQSSVESVIEQLDDIDATSSENFQRIFTNLVQTEYELSTVSYRRAFVDMTVYKR